MATIKELKKYLNYEFSSNIYTGKDYLCFQTKYINYIKSISKLNNWSVENIGRNHYYFSLFITDGNNHIYLSICDVRFNNNEWFNHILIRYAKNEKDYTGEINNYTNLPELENKLKNMFTRRLNDKKDLPTI